jgi:hypothetical protein
MTETLNYVIDGPLPDYLIGFDATTLVGVDEYVADFDRGYCSWDLYRVTPTEWCGPEGSRFKPTEWNGPKPTQESEAKRLAALKDSWNDDDRREAASRRMKESRKTMPQNYTLERNAKVSEGMKRVWELRKLEKSLQNTRSI